MVDIESNELFNSMKKEIDKRIEKANTYLEHKQERLKGTTEKLGTFDKLSINYDIKSYQEQIRKLTELNQTISSLRFSDTDKYNIPKDLKSCFDRLGTLLTEKEVKQLRENINSCIKEVNKGKRDSVRQKAAKAQKLLEQLNIGKNNLLIYNGFNQYTGTTTSFNEALKEAERFQLEGLTSEYSFISSKPAEIKLENGDELFLSTLEEMIENDQLEKNKNTQNITDNFSSIKEAFVAKTKIKKTLLLLNNALSELEKITEVDFSKAESYLKRLESDYKKEIDKVNKTLDKFDFNAIKKEIEKKRAENEKNRLEESKFKEYQHLAYQLEKVMTEHENDHEKIQQIKEAMRAAAMSSGLTNEKLEQAMIEGKGRYQTERQEQKAKVEAAKKRIAYEDELKANVMRQIRQYAIRELESSGAFEEDYEYRNGDVYSKSTDKEAMIQRKIEELKKLADMTPEERGLEDQRKHGFISSNVRVEDLTQQQINDFRIGYSDSAYDFMADYKSWKLREENKPQANNIYREYIKYRASLEDKTQFLSFSEYAKQLHNIENMSDSMVDEELIEELRGVSK